MQTAAGFGDNLRSASKALGTLLALGAGKDRNDRDAQSILDEHLHESEFCVKQSCQRGKATLFAEGNVNKLIDMCPSVPQVMSQSSPYMGHIGTLQPLPKMTRFFKMG